MRRRVVCPRSHPASPFAPGLSVRFAMARGIFRGDTPGPPCRPTLAAAPPLVTHSRAGCALRRPRAWLAAPRVGGASSGGSAGRCAAFADRLGGLIAGRGGRGGGCLRWPLRPWRRIFASDAVVTPHLRFGTGSGAASPFLTFAVAAKLGLGPPRNSRSRSCPPQAPSLLPVPLRASSPPPLRT